MAEIKIEYEKFPYAKPAVISLLFHGVLLVCLAILGVPNSVNKPAEFTAIEVDLVPAAVIEQTKTETEVPVESPPSARSKRPDSGLVPAATRTERLPPAAPGETSAAAVTVAVSAGPGIGEPATAVGQAGRHASAGAGEADHYGNSVRTSPAYLYGAKPVYPQAARKARWEGAVVVRAFIATDGSVVTAEVKEGSGYDILDEAAVQAVKKWRYSPAKKDGVPITSFHDVRVRFRLDEAE